MKHTAVTIEIPPNNQSSILSQFNKLQSVILIFFNLKMWVPTIGRRSSPTTSLAASMMNIFLLLSGTSSTDLPRRGMSTTSNGRPWHSDYSGQWHTPALECTPVDTGRLCSELKLNSQLMFIDFR